MVLLESAMMMGMLSLLGIAVILFLWGLVRWKSPNRRRLLIGSGLALLSAMGMGMALKQLIIRNHRANQLTELENYPFLTTVGQIAPEFEVSTLDGKPLHLSDLRGRVVVLNFFATWCGPCRAELPQLQKLWEAHRDNPEFAMLIVGREETADTVRAFQTENGFTFPMAPDADRTVFSKFARETIPRTVLIDRDGRLIYQVVGNSELALAKIERLVKNHLAGQQ